MSDTKSPIVNVFGGYAWPAAFFLVTVTICATILLCLPADRVTILSKLLQERSAKSAGIPLHTGVNMPVDPFSGDLHGENREIPLTIQLQNPLRVGRLEQIVDDMPLDKVLFIGKKESGEVDVLGIGWRQNVMQFVEPLNPQ